MIQKCKKINKIKKFINVMQLKNGSMETSSAVNSFTYASELSCSRRPPSLSLSLSLSLSRESGSVDWSIIYKKKESKAKGGKKQQ